MFKAVNLNFRASRILLAIALITLTSACGVKLNQQGQGLIDSLAQNSIAEDQSPGVTTPLPQGMNIQYQARGSVCVQNNSGNHYSAFNRLGNDSVFEFVPGANQWNLELSILATLNPSLYFKNGVQILGGRDDRASLREFNLRLHAVFNREHSFQNMCVNQSWHGNIISAPNLANLEGIGFRGPVNLGFSGQSAREASEAEGCSYTQYPQYESVVQNFVTTLLDSTSQVRFYQAVGHFTLAGDANLNQGLSGQDEVDPFDPRTELVEVRPASFIDLRKIRYAMYPGANFCTPNQSLLVELDIVNYKGAEDDGKFSIPQLRELQTEETQQLEMLDAR